MYWVQLIKHQYDELWIVGFKHTLSYVIHNELGKLEAFQPSDWTYSHCLWHLKYYSETDYNLQRTLQYFKNASKFHKQLQGMSCNIELNIKLWSRKTKIIFSWKNILCFYTLAILQQHWSVFFFPQTLWNYDSVRQMWEERDQSLGFN